MAWDALAAVRKAFGGKGAAAAGATAPEAPPAEPENIDDFRAQERAAREAEYQKYVEDLRNLPGGGPTPMSLEQWMDIAGQNPQNDAREREWQLDHASEELREGGYDEETANRYDSESRKEIDPVFYAQTKALANDYARRGLSDSGMSAGAQEDASTRWAAQREMSRQRAIDRATGDRRRQILDSAGLDINLLNYDLQRQQLMLQQEALDAQNNQDFLPQVLGLAGAGLGLATGNPGAAAAGHAGANLASTGSGQGVEPALQVQIDPLTGEQVFVDPYTGTRY